MRVTVTFGARDLANIRFGISPLQHLVFALQAGRAAGCPSYRWWRSVRTRVPGAALPFVELVAANPQYAPDFLTPPIPLARSQGTSPIGEELAGIESVGMAQLHGELQLYEQLGGMPRAARALLDGGERELVRLVDAARALYRACLAPDWPDMHRRLYTDITRRRADLGERGVGSLLAGLDPGWQDPSALSMAFPMQTPDAPEAMVFALEGSGFLLAPNLFLLGGLAPSLSPWQEPSFVYGAVSNPGRPTEPADQDTLAAVLGRGRAAAMRAIATGCTTTELAARMRVSAPTASVHAASLRAAGMSSTVRDGRHVVHTLTALGLAILEANPAPEPGPSAGRDAPRGR